MESNDRTRILSMLQSGKITLEEADQLLGALGTQERPPESAVALKDTRGRKPKKLRVVVDTDKDGSKKNTKVNISIPFSLIKTIGPLVMKNMPEEEKEKLNRSGVDLEQILSDIQELSESALEEDIVNVDTPEGDKVRIYVE